MGLSNNRQALFMGLAVGATNASAIIAILPGVPPEWKAVFIAIVGAAATTIAAVKDVLGGQAAPVKVIP